MTHTQHTNIPEMMTIPTHIKAFLVAIQRLGSEFTDALGWEGGAGIR